MEFCHRPLYNRTEDVKTSIGNSLLFIPCVLIIAGNLMMLIIVLKHKEFGNKSTTNYLIASLAISDLIVGALVIPTAVAEHIAGNWIFGHFWCAVWQYIDATVLVATILTLCAISLDRYWAISDPFRYTQTVTKKHIFIVLTLIWTLSILLIAPPFLLKHRPEYVCTKVSCKCRAILVNQSYAIFGTIVTFIIPLIIITFANYRTYRIGMKQISAVYHEYVPSSSDGGKPRTYIVLKKQLKLTKSTGTPNQFAIAAYHV
ncbi:D(5)-like dopamine receptor [Dinothrombium tinctorium]|uniref:D(5)-like dopamine receptor n=1 Tax=Dinothrombium tinctorium TaxID=1965070 RepID=A0A3S3Q4E1_9ACAR|nr:D(5)-like dopamine receptor [Dinothrombium tinctorium]